MFPLTLYTHYTAGFCVQEWVSRPPSRYSPVISPCIHSECFVRRSGWADLPAGTTRSSHLVYTASVLCAGVGEQTSQQVQPGHLTLYTQRVFCAQEWVRRPPSRYSPVISPPAHRHLQTDAHEFPYSAVVWRQTFRWRDSKIFKNLCFRGKFLNFMSLLRIYLW